MGNKTTIDKRFDYLCDLQVGHVWSVQDLREVLQLRTEIVIAVNNLKCSVDKLAYTVQLLK